MSLLCLTALEVYNPVFQLHSQRFLRRESINRVVMIVGAGTLDTLPRSTPALSSPSKLGQEVHAFIAAFLTGSADEEPALVTAIALGAPSVETDTDNSK